MRSEAIQRGVVVGGGPDKAEGDQDRPTALFWRGEHIGELHGRGVEPLLISSEARRCSRSRLESAIMPDVTEGSPPRAAQRRALDDDQRKHVDLIQAAIARMASASSTAKGWLLPVATATYGYALTQADARVALLGLGAVLLFGTLDAHYLRQERAFRALYRAAVEGRVSTYEMSTVPYYGKANNDEQDERQENCRWPQVIMSWSVGGFYIPILGVGALIACLGQVSALTAH